MDIITLLDALQTLLVPALAVIGITGGLKGLLADVPSFDVGNLHVPGGLWLSWGVALAWVVGGIVWNGGPPPGTEASAYIAMQWPVVAATANVFRNWIANPKPAEPAT